MELQVTTLTVMGRRMNRTQTTYHRRRGQFLLAGCAMFARKIFRQRSKKTC